MSLADAMKPVTRSEMEEYQRLAKIYVEAAAARRRGEATAVDSFSDEANRAMRRYNMSMKVNRLEMLKARIGVANVDSYDRMCEVIGSGLSRAAQQRYEYYAGILGKTVQNPEQAAQTLVNASYHNATWSDRIWTNQERLRDRLGDALRTGLLQGRGAVALARDIRNAFGVSGFEAQRLMRTEMARVRIGAAEQSMQANGNTHYIYLAEPSACPDCAELADQVFPLPDMQPGSNAPPIHPFCRCAVAPHWDDDKYQRWLDGPAQAGVPWAEFENDDILQTGGRETGGHHYMSTPEDEKKDRQAVKAYEKFAREDDSIRIANNTGFDQADIAKIRSHIFSKKHNLYVGYSRFAPDYSMAVAWQRLRNGNYLPRDITLLRHELLEREIEEKYNISISEAHAEASKQYDWWGQVVQEIGEEGEPHGLLQID